VKVFLSHASEDSDIARAIEIALRDEGHTVFLDRSALPSGETYNDRIREALAESDLFVFLISPNAVTRGRYTMNEVELAEARWPRPAEHVLPVLVQPTELASVPVYLRAVTLLEPSGNVPAAVAAAVARLGRPWWRRLVTRWAVALALAAVAAIGVITWWSYQHWLTVAEVADLLKVAELDRQSGDYVAAWDSVARAVAIAPGRREIALAQERVAMDWLDNIKVTVGTGTFSEIVDKVQPVLARCAVSNEARRAADCIAHLGWADFLRAREGSSGPDPVGQYRRAIAVDPHNVYGHAMWGFEISRSGGAASEAAGHFKAALDAGRATPLVRRLQISGLLWRGDQGAEQALVAVADDMRRGGEAMPTDAGGSLSWRLWNVYYRRLVNPQAMESFLSAVPPADHLATFRWLFPEGEVPGDKKNAYLFMRAILEERAGERVHALESYRAVHEGTASGGARATGGTLAARAAEAITRLSKP
jgi:hypothetical protein